MDIFEFEQKHKKVLKNIEEWAYFRINIGRYLKNERAIEELPRKKSFSKKQWLKNIFYGYKHWFSRYDFLFFSDSSERQNIDELYFDKYSDPIIDKLSVKAKKSLVIELANSEHKKNVYTQSCVSDSALTIISVFIKKFIYIKKYKVLIEILSSEGIKIDLEGISKSFNAKYIVYKILLKLYKPQAIFVNCYYCRPYLIKAANELKVKVIELQHGVINREHYAYKSAIEINKLYLPNVLLSFGENESLLKDKLIKEIVPVGSFYLEYIRKFFLPNQKLLQKTIAYKVTIGISMQDEEWEREAMFRFLEDVSGQREDILYLIIPRKKKDFPKFNDNVEVYDSLDCYNTIMHCDIHMSLYSSCALEAPSLGVANILIDEKGFASNYYGRILNTSHTKICKDDKEFFTAIDKLMSVDKESIVQKNENIFFQNYNDNINMFLKEF